MELKQNVHTMKPRRHRVLYKGLHGWIEYVPSKKQWHWSFKAQMTIKNEGEAKTEAEATLALKQYMEAAAVSTNVRSID
jgi:hypothetical protein